MNLGPVRLASFGIALLSLFLFVVPALAQQKVDKKEVKELGTGRNGEATQRDREALQDIRDRTDRLKAKAKEEQAQREKAKAEKPKAEKPKEEKPKPKRP
jgi:hypothetical protein